MKNSLMTENVKSLLLLASYFYDDMDHPLYVANNFEVFSDEWVVGLFHDILEDTDIDEHLLFCHLSLVGKYDMFKEIFNITRKKGETYFEYIRRLDGIAREVKIADLKHHLSRTTTLTLSLKSRYEKALKLLEV